jgi:hypothetical protein
MSEGECCAERRRQEGIVPVRSTFCCDGRKTSCNWLDNGTLQFDKLFGNNDFRMDTTETFVFDMWHDCNNQHEEVHRGHIKCNCVMGVQDPILLPGWTRDQSECAAFAKEVKCLSDKRGYCSNNMVAVSDCRRYLYKLVKDRVREGNKHHCDPPLKVPTWEEESWR